MDIAINELNEIIKEEYSDLLLEDKGNDDGKFSTPFQRMTSFPARAIRYRKAKNVMSKYSKKILSRSEKIIKKFEGELEKSVAEIQKKGEDLQSQLRKARNANDQIEEKAVINQQKKFKADVEKNQSERINHLNQSLDNLIAAYTSGIHKRIDEPGYILKVELSDKGKADLKFLWEEYISTIKQQIYEKLIKIINNKHVKGMESLIARLEVEIEDAEDRRQVSRRSRTNIFNQEKKEYKGRKEEPEKEDKIEDKETKDDKSVSDEMGVDFSTLKKYLDDELPDGLLDDDEPYVIKVGKPAQYYDLYFEIREKTKTITALFYKKDSDFESDSPVKETEIDDIDIADKIINMVKEGEEIESDVDRDIKASKYLDTLKNHMETFFKTREKDIKNIFNAAFYDKYKDHKTMKNFCEFIVGEIMDNPAEYDKQLKLLTNQQISDRQIVHLFLKEFFTKFESQFESFIPFQKYKYSL